MGGRSLEAMDGSKDRVSQRHAAPAAIVAIPACNEEERIGACLEALFQQKGIAPGQLGILLFLNNCTDRTAEAVAGMTDMRWPVRVVEATDPSASAGWARRIAMEAAAAWLREGGRQDGVLLTTDADSRVAPDWLSRNLASLAHGADAVAGRIVLDPYEAALLPPRLHARGRREAAYEALLTEISARLDPEPGNPWPCHRSKSGATIAVRLEAYEAVGGMPDQPAGEDRAFIDALRAKDRVVRHDPDVVVVTSGRLTGRAVGGVADTIRLRCETPDSPCDEWLERLPRAMMRFRLRRRLRQLFETGKLVDTETWAPRLAISRKDARRIAASTHFGEAYAAIEALSQRLDYRPSRPRDLPWQIFLARCTVAVLRKIDERRAAAVDDNEPETRGGMRPLPRLT